MAFYRRVKSYAEVPISHQIVSDMLPEYNRPNDKISELVRKGELISVRRGLYVPGPETDLPVPNVFLVANHLRGPSYVTLESALAYWQIIPERVYEISSATLKTSKSYTNALGRFSFLHVAAPYYSFGIRSVALTAQQTALIASPEKAICDKIVLTSGVLLRSISQTQDFLLEDMRMDEERLRTLNVEMIHSWIPDAPKRSSLQMFLKTLHNL